MSEGVDLLQEAVERLLRESPVDLPGPAALDRLRTVLACAERLKAAQLRAIRDLDQRQLYALDAAGSARGWLRRQPGGDDGQVTLARRLATRPAVSNALADARIGLRSATQLCTALDALPDQLDDALLTAVVHDSIGQLLRHHTGGTPEHPAAAAAVLAQRAADTAVLHACCTDTTDTTDTTATPAARVEPAFVLLAERLGPSQLGPALRLLLDPLQPDGTDQPDTDPYYLELRILADGDVDLRGLLDPETGHSLATEIQRRLEHARTTTTTTKTPRTAPGSDTDTDTDTDTGVDEPQPSAHDDTDTADDPVAADATADADVDVDADVDTGDVDPLLQWDQAMAAADARAARRATQPDGDHRRADRGPDAPLRLPTAGRRRHDALRDLLTDATTAPPGQPPPTHLTIIATLDAVEHRLGALPAQLRTPDGHTTPLHPETLHRLGCNSTLDTVLLDALGNPVGASSTRRMPNHAERRALHARWGPTCAIDGCPHTRTVPHHVIPWSHSHRTQLHDLIPLCTSCHHDLHEGHRTLRLQDGRLIDHHGWTTAHTTAA